MNKTHICTADHPWSREIGGKAEHPDAKYLGDDDQGNEGYYEEYHCPHCGKFFTVELPQ